MLEKEDLESIKGSSAGSYAGMMILSEHPTHFTREQDRIESGQQALLPQEKLDTSCIKHISYLRLSHFDTQVE
jgi:hypothetical protein